MIILNYELQRMWKEDVAAGRKVDWWWWNRCIYLL
jgi:hypothetical protein